MEDKTVLRHFNATNNNCPLCNKVIAEDEVKDKDKIAWNKTKRNTWVFFHIQCYKNSLSKRSWQ